MSERIEGRLGDVSGRLGDVSGRLGDVSGRLGDVSGRLGDVSGRLGDVSGRASSDDVQDCLFEDRQADRRRYVESRLFRVENEVVLVMRWVAAQLQMLKEGMQSDDTADQIRSVAEQATRIQDRVEALERGLQELRNK